MLKSLRDTLLCAVLSTAALAQAQADAASFSYIPEVHGVMRSRWEIRTESGEQRFQLRNARVSIQGKVAPAISYFVQTDFCNRGKIVFLDAYAKLNIIKDLYIQAGQFRMPFGIEPHLAPATYYFANRSFIGKQMMNYRAVGFKMGYKLPGFPLSVEGGAFNPSTVDDQVSYSKTFAYSAKAILSLPEGFKVCASYGSVRPGIYRANLIGAYLGWQNENLLVAGEYIYQHYCRHHYKPAHGWLAFADWHRAVKWGIFNRWSIQGRADGMTAQYQLKRDKENPEDADTFNPARTRLTIGSTLTYEHKKFGCDIRLNYENYCQWKGSGKAPSLFTAELVLRF